MTMQKMDPDERECPKVKDVVQAEVNVWHETGT